MEVGESIFKGDNYEEDLNLLTNLMEELKNIYPGKFNHLFLCSKNFSRSDIKEMKLRVSTDFDQEIVAYLLFMFLAQPKYKRLRDMVFRNLITASNVGTEEAIKHMTKWMNESSSKEADEILKNIMGDEEI